MKQLIATVLINYAVLGFVHMSFTLLLAKKPTVRLALTEFLLWPRRTWRGLKVIKRDAWRLDL